MSSSLNSAEFPRQAILRYALPGAVMAMPLIPAFVLLPAFYAETVGLGLVRTGLILLLVRISDVISDPIVGLLSDYLRRWRLGKKIQIAIGAIICGSALYALFTPSESAGDLYLFVWYGLLLLGWTIVQIPYLAWTVELTSDYHARVSLNATRELSGLVGILALSIFLVITADYGARQQLAYAAVFVVGCGVIVFPLLLSLPTGRLHQPPLKLLKSLSGLSGNRLFFRLLSAWFLSGLSIGIATACFPLFITHVLVLPEAYNSYLLFIYFLSGILGIPLWIWLSGRLGKHRSWGIAMVIACLAFLTVPLIGAGDLMFFGVICLITGFSLGADLALPPAMQSDVADWDNYLNRRDSSSFLFALWSMATKLSLGLGVAGAFVILGQGDLGQPSGDAEIDPFRLAVIYGWLPAVLKITAVALMWGYPLTARQQQAINRRLQRRNRPLS
ncbi:MFS transporter [Sneathiella sp. CAU 1612]|uniref:MFS transporter n=1 Tax=Sneathiella sedimenti TaxID=2816034 RepID=A0ABS3F473_9PROT|nr:MFS transporter [Sneathiella sedimenti]MBO0333314.1 MFS transporter [Sneathiella sedimenti]